MDGYVEVSERIEQFYKKYPMGSLRCKEWSVETAGDQTFFVYVAQAFRNPDDEAPAEGIAWEPVPGKTNFTRDSEAMNCETSAWGRAIAALGFEVKRGIASANEVRARGGNTNGEASPQQKGYLASLLKKGGASPEEQNAIVTHKADGKPLTKALAGQMIDALGGETKEVVAKWKGELA